MCTIILLIYVHMPAVTNDQNQIQKTLHELFFCIILFIIGWYDELARRMAMNGFVVFGHDHRGHGRSEGKRAYIEK